MKNQPVVCDNFLWRIKYRDATDAYIYYAIKILKDSRSHKRVLITQCKETPFNKISVFLLQEDECANLFEYDTETKNDTKLETWIKHKLEEKHNVIFQNG